MCGITGFYNSSKPTDQFPKLIEGQLSFIRHRGPDQMGYYFDDEVGLGAARLSILDLTTSNQPFFSEDKRYWIAYNGEVYNYKELRLELQQKGMVFRSTGDTEVVLAAWIAWGVESFKKLNGGFAFAIYDRKEKELILVRDRYGKRPLFFTQVGSEIIFGSEMKCFLARSEVSFRFDADQLASIARVWTTVGDQTGFKNIFQLPESSYLRARGDEIDIQSYETLNIEVGQADIKNESELIAETVSVLEKSVQLRLRSDVPVGSYLSGGLDSSIITYLAQKNVSKKIHTFSVAFENKDFDERKFQIETSQHLGTLHTAVEVSEKDISDRFLEAIWHSEVPVFRTAFVPMFLLSEEVRKAGIKVVLTGEGSDEAFLGYDIYKETLLREDWKSIQDQSSRLNRIGQLYPYLNHFGSENAKALIPVFEQFSKRGSPYFSHDLRFHNSTVARKLIRSSSEGLEPLDDLIKTSGVSYSRLNELQKSQWLEMKTLLSGYLLSTQGDRMSLGNSVENRCPFLDPHVVNWAFQLPQEMRLREKQNEKYILKEAFKDVLPKSVIDRYKQPYRAPDAEVFIRFPNDESERMRSAAYLSEIESLDFTFASRLVQKIQFAGTNSKISPRENQAFIFLHSIVCLQKLFVERNHPAVAPIQDILTIAYDGRGNS